MQKQKRRYLEFEQGLADLDDQIAQLKNLKLQGQVDLSSEIRNLENKAEALLRSICANLTSYQKVQISRHPDRPGTIDYIRLIFDDFVEMHGDRSFRDDASIIGGLASLEGRSLMLIGHQKGKNTEENMKRNFGMPRPEGYRKALRLMKTAERWKIPVLTFIDTPGAYPGIDAEERGQAEAIARNIMKMFGLKIPTLACILGEGGSGGALALACADRVLMMEYSVYSVISPEGCAAITWKDGAHTAAAAEALKLTAKDNEALKVAERIVPEPLGGAHRNEFLAAQNLKSVLSEELDGLVKMSADKREEQRYLRYRGFGRSAQQIVKEGLKKIHMSRLVITIDGPAGSGKSTLAKKLAEHFRIPYIDTGAMYRAVAYFGLKQGIDIEAIDELCEIAERLQFEFRNSGGDFEVFASFGGSTFQKLGTEIRSPEISMGASNVARYPRLREILVRTQQDIGHKAGGVLEGRDAGTVIFPDAPIKFYFTASPEIRAERRLKELQASMGSEAPSFEVVLADVKARDYQDENREVSPLKPASDAIWVDSSDRPIDDIFHELCSKVDERLQKSV